MHQFEKPPTVILDLGCGSGFWAIEAAKHWAVCDVVFYIALTYTSSAD
jgi:methylase of polypeptide subunit release factors